MHDERRRLLKRVLDSLGFKLVRSKKFAERSWSCARIENLDIEKPDEVKTLRCLLAKRGKRGSEDDSPVRFPKIALGDLPFQVHGAATHFRDEEELVMKLDLLDEKRKR